MPYRSVITVPLTMVLFVAVPASIFAQSRFHFEVEVPFEFPKPRRPSSFSAAPIEPNCRIE